MTSIIVDDEQYSGEALFLLLKKYCPEVKVMGIESNAENAIKSINALKPDLVFLDIELQSTNAFLLMEQLNIYCGFIFTTAYDKYALKAFKVEAIDYLLKPVDHIELIKAVEKAKRSYLIKPQTNSNSVYLEKISLNTGDGTIFVKIDDIIHCEADTSYTHIYLQNKDKVSISKNLGSFEKSVLHTTLMRVHKSHIINLKHVVKYLKGEGGEIFMSNGNNVPISREKKEEFLKMMGQLC